MEYNSSDKLAIALACLAGVMAIILFLAEKTAMTVILLLLFMLALAVYPILHFARRIGVRMVAFGLFAIGTLLFGWYVWPHNHSISASTQQTRQPPQEPQQPKPEEKKADKKGQDEKKQEVKPKPKVEPSPNINVGSIEQGPCSNLQIGGSNNQATTNCIPSEVFDVNGFKHTLTPSGSHAEAGEQFSAFNQMQSLGKAKDWPALKEAAQEQMKEAPSWPFPYFELAIAYANLCQTAEAIGNMQTFLGKARAISKYNKTYDEAIAMAERDLGILTEGKWPTKCK